jgi:hypothetical protein
MFYSYFHWLKLKTYRGYHVNVLLSKQKNKSYTTQKKITYLSLNTYFSKGLLNRKMTVSYEFEVLLSKNIQA